jgi:hypothetical protein
MARKGYKNMKKEVIDFIGLVPKNTGKHFLYPWHLMRYFLLGMVGVLSCAVPAWAELGVCFDAARPLGTQFYWSMRSPEQIQAQPKCTLVTKASGQTQNQLDLIHSTTDRGGALGIQPVDPRYLKVVPDPPTAGGLATLMTPAEMQAVDDFAAQQAAPRIVADNEVKNNEVCANNTLQQISDYWVGPAPESKKSQLTAQIAAVDALIATWDTKITPLAAGAPKDAMIAARAAVKGIRDADVFFMNMMTQSFELIWRYTCSRTYLRP